MDRLTLTSKEPRQHSLLLSAHTCSGIPGPLQKEWGVQLRGLGWERAVTRPCTLAKRTPGLDPRAGSAEQLPLPQTHFPPERPDHTLMNSLRAGLCSWDTSRYRVQSRGLTNPQQLSGSQATFVS